MRDRERELERGRGRKGKEDEGDREVTPPPVPSPSPEYLALAADAPSTLSEISSSRKLLVLDLNGTLVFRSPHSSRTRNRGFPRLRPTYPRPYMRAFREYLFAPETKAWLDVMVWSSAQPHSVGDMVDKCFGSWKRELVAVWARDTLGLSNDHYHRKVQTLKDLSRPCVAPQVHSALTTLLLDDSPSKAALQPYNHFCIPEYTQERRNKDLDSFQKEQEWLLALERRKLLQAQLTKDEKAAQKESRNAKRRKHFEEPMLTPEVKRPDLSYDETLLAVVGVLDEVHCQRNVAAWVRAGGLWGPGGVPTHLKQAVRERSAEEGDAVMEVDESTARPAGNDEVTQTAPTDSKGIADLPADAPEAPAALMWFEDSEVIVYWATRGREALETLGIPVEHGMEG
ncbi:uncharacterized protein B0H18DRAFT_875536 [Fomitopsis serialis]|uniref:uncharacterized protein n=1 Tax=Fomitopsis serialis TaxID=139415 RepID=UPI0020084FF0|nr:uncharacterized protein B0H18DRAFT_875536 [Neoantrodia serialis]KAH9927644.1 hypothetical protein B0H18DRAFT_875536 [Neoantrodia serialis]